MCQVIEIQHPSCYADCTRRMYKTLVCSPCVGYREIVDEGCQKRSLSINFDHALKVLGTLSVDTPKRCFNCALLYRHALSCQYDGAVAAAINAVHTAGSVIAETTDLDEGCKRNIRGVEKHLSSATAELERLRWQRNSALAIFEEEQQYDPFWYQNQDFGRYDNFVKGYFRGKLKRKLARKPKTKQRAKTKRPILEAGADEGSVWDKY